MASRCERAFFKIRVFIKDPAGAVFGGFVRITPLFPFLLLILLFAGFALGFFGFVLLALTGFLRFFVALSLFAGLLGTFVFGFAFLAGFLRFAFAGLGLRLAFAGLRLRHGFLGLLLLFV